MKKTLLTLLLALEFGAGCNRHAEIDYPSEKQVSFREAADECDTNGKQMMLEVATNQVVGIHAVVDSYNPTVSVLESTNWEGWMKVDYVNPVGGMSRTNLYFKFWCATNDGSCHFYCIFDFDRYWQEETNRWAEEERKWKEQEKEDQSTYDKFMAALTNSEDVDGSVLTGPTPEQIAAAKKAEQDRVKRVAASTLKWLEDQAAQGNAYAQRRLGERYLKGDGVETNFAKAKQLLIQATAQGDKEAADMLAGLDHAQ